MNGPRRNSEQIIHANQAGQTKSGCVTATKALDDAGAVEGKAGAHGDLAKQHNLAYNIGEEWPQFASSEGLGIILQTAGSGPNGAKLGE